LTAFCCPVDFDDHKSASYDLAMGLEQNEETKEKEERRLSQNEFSELIKRNTDAFVSGQVDEDSDFEEDVEEEVAGEDRELGEAREVEVDEGSYTVVSTKNDPSPREPNEAPEATAEAVEPSDENRDDFSGDNWAKTFLWADGESVVAR
jgi:hypothetical protein